MNEMLKAGSPPAQDSLAPGSKDHLRAQARELGVSSRGTKEQIWSRISDKQSANVKRRVRSPQQASPETAPEGETAATPEPPQSEALEAVEPFQAATNAQSQDFEAQLAEIQALLQQIDQAQEAGPVSNAAASQRVVSMPAPQNRMIASY